ncbi:MAG: AraC family transcriptional regulator [Acidobacteriota bacterium]|jgi:AraC family transcriptional regulator|nr:AraC family transcriptional regulator [Acidobacteriota bacterium]
MGWNASSSMEHNGEIIDSKLIAGFHLTETAYAPRVKVPSHSHRYACFCFVLQGTYTETYRGKTIECRPSHLVFRPAEEMHADHFGDRGVRCFIIEVETQWLMSLRERSIGMDKPASFQSVSLAWLAMKLRSESRQADAFTSLAVEGLMLEMCAEIARRSSKTSERQPPRWLNQAKEILHENFTEQMTLSDIAESVGVHPVYLAGVFRQHYHCTIGEYVRRLRIEFASRELARTAAPLIDIALASGFAHQSHFSRTFKRLTGLTPAQYRAATRSS